MRGGEFSKYATLDCKIKVCNISSPVSSPSQPSTKLFNLCGKQYDKSADYVLNFVPCSGNDAIRRNLVPGILNSACTITEVGPQRAVDEPLYNK